MSERSSDRAGLTFPPQRRLRHKREFEQLYARGRRLGNVHFGVTLRSNEAGGPRLGLAVASKTAGGSVERNRIRRLIRESFRLHQHGLPAVDLVVSARAPARRAPAPELRGSLEGLWDKVRAACATSQSS